MFYLISALLILPQTLHSESLKRDKLLPATGHLHILSLHPGIPSPPCQTIAWPPPSQHPSFSPNVIYSEVFHPVSLREVPYRITPVYLNYSPCQGLCIGYMCVSLSIALSLCLH